MRMAARKAEGVVSMVVILSVFTPGSMGRELSFAFASVEAGVCRVTGVAYEPLPILAFGNSHTKAE